MSQDTFQLKLKPGLLLPIAGGVSALTLIRTYGTLDRLRARGVTTPPQWIVSLVLGSMLCGVALIAGDEGQRIDLSSIGLPLELVFQKGRPLLGRGAAKDVTFNDEPLGDVRVQLIREDRVIVDGDEIEIG